MWSSSLTIDVDNEKDNVLPSKSSSLRTSTFNTSQQTMTTKSSEDDERESLFSKNQFQEGPKTNTSSLYSNDPNCNSVLWTSESNDTTENVGRYFDLLSISKEPQSDLSQLTPQNKRSGDQKLIDSLIWSSPINENMKSVEERPSETKALSLSQSMFPSNAEDYFNRYSPTTKLSIVPPTQQLSHVIPRSISPLTKKCMDIANEYAVSVMPKTPSKSTKDKHKIKNEDSTDGFIYLVRFKRAHRAFVLAPTAPRNIQPGMFVKVEADRGEDLGVVLAKVQANEYEEDIPTAGYRGRGFSSGIGERKYILRLATPHEKLLIAEKVEEEEKVLATIREKVLQRNLPMVILDAEFQFDRHKLTYFFEADRRIDFRELVSELFSLYKTRIWMQQVDTTTIPQAEDPEVRLAYASGLLPRSSQLSVLRSYTGALLLQGGYEDTPLKSPMIQSSPHPGDDSRLYGEYFSPRRNAIPQSSPRLNADYQQYLDMRQNKVFQNPWPYAYHG